MDSPITVISLGAPGAASQISAALQKKRNIILIGKSKSAICEALGQSVNLDGYIPDEIHRWGIYSLSDVLTPDHLNLLLTADGEKKSICIVEQIKLPSSRPPQVKPVIIYSEPQGIISELETIQGAREFLSKNLNAWSRLQKFPLAGVYQWIGGEWQKARVFV